MSNITGALPGKNYTQVGNLGWRHWSSCLMLNIGTNLFMEGIFLDHILLAGLLHSEKQIPHKFCLCD